MYQVLSFDEQIKSLKKKGLKSIKYNELERFLTEVSYYRLIGFCKLFERDNIKNKLISSFTMDKLINIYKFDCKLRNIINEIIDYIEISIKTQISFHLSNLGSSNFYNEFKYFNNYKYFKEMQIVINGCIDKDLKIRELSNYKHGEIPIYILIEYLPLGLVSRMYANLKPEFQKMVSDGSLYSIKYSYFVNYLYVLSYLRNICSHRGRLYGKRFSCNPKYTNEEYLKLQINYSENYVCTLFMCLFVIVKLIPNNNLKEKSLNRIYKTIVKYSKYIELSKIGFPKNWKQILTNSK